jgi:ATP-binding cassette subfamily C protein CydCD
VRSRDQILANLVGVVWAISNIALLWSLTDGIVDLTHHLRDRGIALIGISLLSRILVTRCVASRNDRHARVERRALRGLIFHQLSHNHDADVVAIATAIDDASAWAAFETLRAATGISALCLPALFIVAGWLPAAVVIALTVLSVPFYIRAGKNAAQADEAFRAHRADLTKYQLSVLTHSVELRGLGATAYGANTVVALTDREHRGAMDAIRKALGSSLVTEFLGGVSVGLVAMIVGLGLLHGTVRLQPALLALFLTAEFVGWVRRYGIAFHQRERLEHAREVLAQPNHIGATFLDNNTLLASTAVVTSCSPRPVTVSVSPGDHLHVFGSSGSGKTTLIETWLRWRPPQSGSVVITNAPVGVIGPSSQLGFGTVRDCLLVGTSCSDHVLQGALDEVGLSINLDTVLSSDGDGVSTGERVRLLIARALIHTCALLILDDIAGVLDVDSQHRVREAIARRHDLAVVECGVNAAVFISPTSVVTLP